MGSTQPLGLRGDFNVPGAAGLHLSQTQPGPDRGHRLLRPLHLQRHPPRHRRSHLKEAHVRAMASSGGLT